jgi:GNAT superfamily N-acetyltransferase
MPYKGVIARVAEDSDLPAIRALIRPIYEEPSFNDGKRGFHLWRVGRFYDRFPHIVDEEYFGEDPGRRFAVVLQHKRSGRIVGVGVLIKPQNDDPAVGEISKVYLAPEYRGLGLGYWMMQVLLREGRNRGYNRISILTRIEFEGAIELYKRVGFLQVANTKYPGVKNSIALEYAF